MIASLFLRRCLNCSRARTRAHFHLLSLLVSALLVSGCGPSPTAESFAEIHPSMTLSQVEAILGQGTELFPGDPGVPAGAVQTAEEIAVLGPANYRWFKWSIDGQDLLIGVEDDEVFTVERDR